jgi:hypothetical protein
MVEDAIAALKDRPGSTQADIFNYLEAKYEGRISPKNKHNLQTVIRSVIQSKKRLRTGMGGRKATTRRGPGRLKGKGRKLGGRGLPRGRARGIMGRPPGKGFKLKLVMPKSLKTPKSLKSGKKLVMPRAKGPGGLLRRVKRGTGRGGKLSLRPARRTTSEGSICLPRMNGRMRRN